MRTSQTLTANGTYKILDAFRRKDAPEYSATLFAYASGSGGAFTKTCATHTTTKLDVASTVGITAGMVVSGTDIAAGTTVASVDSATQVTLSQAATGTHSGLTITFTSTWGGGTIAWYLSYDRGVTLLPLLDLTGAAVSQTANGNVRTAIDSGVNLDQSTEIYAVLSGATNPVIQVGLSDNN